MSRREEHGEICTGPLHTCPPDGVSVSAEMCGRFRTKNSDPEEYGSVNRADWGPAIADALGQLEVRPTDPIAIVRESASQGQRVGEVIRWGIQPPGSKRPLINARDDKLLTQGLWKTFATRHGGRCAILGDGWYEWLSAEDPRAPKQPFLHTVDGDSPFAFAGLYGYAIVKGEKVPAATIITTGSAGDPARIHDRQPVILDGQEAIDAWLTESDAESVVDALCQPLPPGRVAVQPIELPKAPPKKKAAAKPETPSLFDEQ